MNLLNCKIKELTALIRDKKLSAQELCQFYLDRIEKLNPGLNAVLTAGADGALKQAREIDTHFDKYKDLPLVGVPVLLKDIFCVKNMPTTAGSKILENFIPPYTASAVQKLLLAGAVILGKCNQDEFAMGNGNTLSAFGPALNPWNKAYVPGGSSGGSASAVSAGLCAFSLGTDTGGSIRQPSAFCNLVGVKPTYGRVSRYGMIAYGSSLDQAGPMTMYVEDSALVLEQISGKDPKDNTSADWPIPAWSRNLNKNIKNLKVGVLNPEQAKKSCTPGALQILEKVKSLFVSHGAEVEEVSFPLLEMSVPVYYLISVSEASSNLARYDGVRYGQRFEDPTPTDLETFYSHTRGRGFGAEVKRRIIMGTYCLSTGYYDEYYNKASQIRRQIRDQFIDIFSRYSLLLSPVAPGGAFKLTENPAGSLESYLIDSFTVSANLAGLPALSLPAGFVEGLPVGVQLTANHFEEQTLFNTALFMEEKMQVAGKRPQI